MVATFTPCPVRDLAFTLLLVGSFTNLTTTSGEGNRGSPVALAVRRLLARLELQPHPRHERAARVVLREGRVLELEVGALLRLVQVDHVEGELRPPRLV